MTNPAAVQPTIMDDIKGMGPTLASVGEGISDAFNYAAEHFPTATKWGIFIGTALVGGRLAHMVASNIPGLGQYMNNPIGGLLCFVGAAFAGNYLGNNAVGAYGRQNAPGLDASSPEGAVPQDGAPAEGAPAEGAPADGAPTGDAPADAPPAAEGSPLDDPFAAPPPAAPPPARPPGPGGP